MWSGSEIHADLSSTISVHGCSNFLLHNEAVMESYRTVVHYSKADLRLMG
jgi:hypothetical protein